MRGGAFLNGKEGFCPPGTGEPRGVKTIEGRFSKKLLFCQRSGRGFRKCIRSNHPITYQRYKKSNRHTARSIRNIPHDYWSNRTTHYRHDKQRRSKLGLCTRISQCQREDSRKHDALSQIQGEERNER